MIHLSRSKGQTGEDILPLKMRKIAQQFGFANTSGKKIEDVLHPNTHAADTRAAALVRIEGVAIYDTEPDSHAESSKGSATPLGFAYRSPAQITLTPMRSTWRRSSAS